MPYIASTLTSPTRYVDWLRAGDGSLVEKRSVTIKGGFGLADKNFVTHQGAVLTSVSDDELAFLESDSHFKEHVKEGFLKVFRKGSVEGEKAADGMKLGDKSQPLNPLQFKSKTKDDVEALTVNTGPVGR